MTENNSFTNAGKRETLLQETQARFPYLIKVTIGENIYCYANYSEDIEYDGETYVASFFELRPPAKNTENKNTASISFSNMDNFWTQQVRTHNDQLYLEFVATIIYEDDNNISYIEPIDYYRFKLSGDASWTESSCKFDLVADDKGEVLVPCDVADSLNTMGVV